MEIKELRVVPTWLSHGGLLLVMSDAYQRGARHFWMLILPMNTWFLWVHCLPSYLGPTLLLMFPFLSPCLNLEHPTRLIIYFILSGFIL